MSHKQTKSPEEPLEIESERIQSLIAALRKRDPESLKFLSRSIFLADSMAQNEGEAPVRRKALAFADLLEKMEIRIVPGERIVGYYPREKAEEVDRDRIAEAERFLGPYTAKQQHKKQRAEFATRMGGAGSPFNPRVAHAILDYPKGLRLGLGGLIAEVDAKLAGTSDDDACVFYQACRISLNGVSRFALRYADLASALGEEAGDSDRSRELSEISRICRKVSTDPPETFQEAMQFLWFLHLWKYLEAPGFGDSLGRFDQYMLEFYERDSQGSQDALELLACFWIKINELGFSVSSQNLTVGGLLPDGTDGTNALTYLALEATRAVYLRLPHLSLRVHGSTPDRLLSEVPVTAAQGAGQPQLYNDDVVIPSLVARGIPRSLAVDYAIQGCIQIYLPGLSSSWSDVFLNLGKCVELAINDGESFSDDLKSRDPSGNIWLEGKTSGPRTGRPENFDPFEKVYQAFVAQMRHFMGVMGESLASVDRTQAEVESVPFASTLTGDCLDRGLDALHGGARYRLSGIFSVGVATAADSLAVIREILEGENPLGITLRDLVDELKSNFESSPRVRQWALSVPKYGNDVDSVDALATRLSRDFCDEVLKLPVSEGTLIWPVLSSYIINVRQGQVTSATPDGRLAGEPLSNTLCPSFGQDKLGPTAIIRSTCKIDFKDAVGGALLNMKFLPSQLGNTQGQTTLQSLLRTYIDLGGRQLQINCIDNQTLRNAQADPASYPSLIVRVSGFSARFVDLTKDLQDEIINRTELELG